MCNAKSVEAKVKVAIMGTGGVGGVFGARLAQSGTDVTFIARGNHLAAIKKSGLKVTSERRGHAHINPAVATDDPRTVGKVDFVFLTTKLWDTKTAAEAIKPMIGPDSAVISFQNGIEKDDVLRSLLGAEHVVGGVSYVAATIAEPGVISQRGDAQKLAFGEYTLPYSDSTPVPTTI
jgi:2-dehydropantoate 2-reductase